jgi:hypothetical protein
VVEAVRTGMLKAGVSSKLLDGAVAVFIQSHKFASGQRRMSSPTVSIGCCTKGISQRGAGDVDRRDQNFTSSTDRLPRGSQPS